jgi:hypothetical protein
MEALLLVAEHDGPTMFARIGGMRALQRHQPKTAPAPCRKRAKFYGIVRWLSLLKNCARQGSNSKDKGLLCPIRSDLD